MTKTPRKAIMFRSQLKNIYFKNKSDTDRSNYRAVATHCEVGGGPNRNTPTLLPFPSPPLPFPPLPAGKRTLVALAGENFKIKVSTWPENTLPGSHNL